MGTEGATKRNVRVGIMTKPEWHFRLYSNGVCTDETVGYSNGFIVYKGEKHLSLSFNNLQKFTLYEVMIGVGFHWQQAETQTFYGSLHFLVNGNGILALNELPVEE